MRNLVFGGSRSHKGVFDILVEVLVVTCMGKSQRRNRFCMHVAAQEHHVAIIFLAAA